MIFAALVSPAGGHLVAHAPAGGLMTDTQTLTPARQLADTNKARFPDESAEYRAARNALLVAKRLSSVATSSR